MEFGLLCALGVFGGFSWGASGEGGGGGEGGRGRGITDIPTYSMVRGGGEDGEIALVDVGRRIGRVLEGAAVLFFDGMGWGDVGFLV